MGKSSPRDPRIVKGNLIDFATLSAWLLCIRREPNWFLAFSASKRKPESEPLKSLHDCGNLRRKLPNSIGRKEAIRSLSRTSRIHHRAALKGTILIPNSVHLDDGLGVSLSLDDVELKEWCRSHGAENYTALLGVDRASYRYEPRPDRNAELRDELVKLARQKPRYGYRRLHAVLERRGQAVNVKRVYRLYVEQGKSALLHSPETLVEILMRASTIAQDRRKVRYPRLRKAVEAGLEPAGVLSAKQPKGKRKRRRNDAVVPDLPDEITARLSRKIEQG